MTTYELTFLISPELQEEGIKALQERIGSFAQEAGGLIEESQIPVKRRLAFPIEKRKEAYFSFLKFQLEAANLANFKEKVKAEKDVLRYLLLVKKRLKEAKRIRRPVFVKKEAPKQKVELKEIEKKIEEILGE